VLGLLVAPALLYIALVISERRRRRFELDSGLRRRHSALRTARRSIGRLEGNDRTELARQASRCLRTYIGDKLGLEGSALTPTEVRETLIETGVAEELVGRVDDSLNRLEAAQYGAARVERSQLAGELRELISELERGLKGRTP
jgi:hypothetical protein